MKKIFFLLFLTIAGQAFANEFKVKFFTYNPNSQIAVRYPRLDQNNQACALVLIETRLRGIVFEANQAVVGDIRLKQGKFYLYIPSSTTTLKFTKEGFETLEYSLPLTVRPSGVYDLNLDAIIIEKPVEEVAVVTQEETPPPSTPEPPKTEEKIPVKVEEKKPEPKEVIVSETVAEKPIPEEKKETIVKEEPAPVEKQEIVDAVKTPEPKQEEAPVEATPEPVIKEVVEEIPEVPVEDIMLINDIPLKTAPEQIENMIFVQGGCFNMGSHFGSKDELPVHKVCLDDYYIGKYEVTIEEYTEFLNGTACNPDGTKDNQKLVSIGTKIKYENSIFIYDSKDAKLPATTVSWYGAKAYAEWAEGRLPTEAEWEFAARGGLKMKPTAYAGSDSIYDVSMYARSSGNRPHNVGSKAANELGIFDMSGNAYEWVEDMYHKEYYKKSPEENPQGSPYGQTRVMRGGSFGDKDADCRVANRHKYTPANSMYFFGFRIAKSIPSTEE